MTPSDIRNEIVDRFGCLVRCDDLKVDTNDTLGILTLRGKISAVEAMHDHIMQGDHFPKGSGAIVVIQQLRKLASALEQEINDGVKA